MRWILDCIFVEFFGRRCHELTIQELLRNSQENTGDSITADSYVFLTLVSRFWSLDCGRAPRWLRISCDARDPIWPQVFIL